MKMLKLNQDENSQKYQIFEKGFMFSWVLIRSPPRRDVLR